MSIIILLSTLLGRFKIIFSPIQRKLALNRHFQNISKTIFELELNNVIIVFSHLQVSSAIGKTTLPWHRTNNLMPYMNRKWTDMTWILFMKILDKMDMIKTCIMKILISEVSVGDNQRRENIEI